MGTLLGLIAVTLVGAATALWFRAALAVRLPENRSAYVATWLGGALLGAVALGQGPGWIGGLAAALALLAGGVLCVLIAISRQEVAPDAVSVGERLRAFSAPDERGESFALASAPGKPLLLKFFRGHW